MRLGVIDDGIPSVLLAVLPELSVLLRAKACAYAVPLTGYFFWVSEAGGANSGSHRARSSSARICSRRAIIAFATS